MTMRAGGSPKNTEFDIELCREVFYDLFPKAKGSRSITLEIYRRKIAGAVAIFAKQNNIFIRWGKTKDCHDVILEGDSFFWEYLPKKPTRFWLKVSLDK